MNALKRIALLAALAVAAGLFAGNGLTVGAKTLVAKGVAANYRAAVNEALVSALEQHLGVVVDSTEVARVSGSDVGVSASENGALTEQVKNTVNDSIEKEMKKWAKGRIDSYVVLEDSFDPETRRYTVQVEVRFGQYGDVPSNRRRMAVGAFRPARAGFAWYGQAGAALDWTTALSDKLNVYLTQTRKFAMLDRKYDAEVDAELARLTGPNAAPADAVRLSQKLGTDYLVVGEVSLNDVQAPPVNPYTGRAVSVGPTLFAEVSYRVLLAPTGQLKWTDVVRIDARAFAAADLASFVSATSDAAAKAIADGMMENILPFEVVGRTSAGTLVIGEGGRSLKVGEFFTVFALGEEVRDTRTGDVLDRIEEAVGTVQIVRVSPKTSYAQVVEGDAGKIAVGSRLRRVPPSAGAAPAPQPVAPSVTVTPGGVIAPF